MDKQHQMSLGVTIGRVMIVLFTLFLFVTHSYGITVYSTEFLRSLRPDGLVPSVKSVSTLNHIKNVYSAPVNGSDSGCDKNPNKRKRGRRGGKLVKLRKRNQKPPLPSIFLSNTRSLYNKTDELFTRIKNHREYANCQVFCFTESWLTKDHTDSLLTPKGFNIFRSDRDPIKTGKKKGGGVCFMINQMYCKNVSVISKGCSENLEYLTIKCRPFYLPREFSSITLTAVYIHPRADVGLALSELSNVINNYENKDPDTMSIILGDFNQSNLTSVLPNFKQCVTCPTRGENIIDHCYVNTSFNNQVYKSVIRSNLGESDHSMIYLIPTYKQKLKSEKPVSVSVEKWNDSSIELLRDCFDRTNWSVFRDLWSSIHEVTETISDYIYFCKELCIEKRTVTVYPNNNVWFDRSVRKQIVAKDKAYKNKLNDPETYRCEKSNLKKKIKEIKQNHKNKLNEHFNSSDSRQLWSKMSLITNYKGTSQSVDSSDITLPDKLNHFYARFDRENFTTPVRQATDDCAPPSFVVSFHDVRRSFLRLNERKAAGPDNISPRILKQCNFQLAVPFCYIFNWSLETSVVPSCFKKSSIIPVPKKSSPQSLNDYRPVALTSVAMKCFEFLVKVNIQSLLPVGFDPYQFAYRKNRCTEDAINILVHEVLNHLEGKNTYARVLFIDFSSAFNTIIPIKLIEKLHILNFPMDVCNWILDFLLDRPQVVKIKSNVSSSLVLNTGAPQGCVLSPSLYSIFTFDCEALDENSLIVKFADDTTEAGLITNDNESLYFEQVDALTEWCEVNNLDLNIPKTNEMIIDFRRKISVTPTPLKINNKIVEQVPCFKLLGTILNNTLTWSNHCEFILGKARQRLYFLRKLKSFGVDKKILLLFYSAIVEKIVSQSITVWYTRATKHDIAKLTSVINTSERLLGLSLPPLSTIFESRMENNTKKIMADKYHPANKYFDFLPSGKRLRACFGNRRFVDSYFSSAIKHFNNKV